MADFRFSLADKEKLLNAQARGGKHFAFKNGTLVKIVDALKEIEAAEAAVGAMSNEDLIAMAKRCFDRTEAGISKQPAGMQMTQMVDCLDALALALANRLECSEKALCDLRAQLGWRLCSEELPETAGYYRTTVVLRRGGVESMRMTAKRRFCDNRRWHGSCEAREIVAWQDDVPYAGPVQPCTDVKKEVTGLKEDCTCKMG